jgi:hypothetical protein
LDKKAVPWKTNQPQKGENKTDTHGWSQTAPWSSHFKL